MLPSTVVAEPHINTELGRNVYFILIRANDVQHTLPKMERPCSCCKDYKRYHGDKDVDILVSAARRRHYKCVESAVKRGADVNVISRALIKSCSTWRNQMRENSFDIGAR